MSKSTSQDKPVVPFHFFRVGAVVEFVVYEGRPPIVGTVRALRMGTSAARDYLAVLETPAETHDGYAVINTSHATRILSHSTGPLVFDKSESWGANVAAHAKRIRKAGRVARSGNRLRFEGRYAVAMADSACLACDYIERHKESLGVLPWDCIDGSALVEGLIKVGILRKLHDAPRLQDSRWSPPSDWTLDTKRMASYLKQNINRYKQSKKKLQAMFDAQEAADEQRYLADDSY